MAICDVIPVDTMQTLPLSPKTLKPTIESFWLHLPRLFRFSLSNRTYEGFLETAHFWNIFSKTLLSDGDYMFTFGIVLKIAISSIKWWVGPAVS